MKKDYYAGIRSLILEGSIYKAFISEDHDLYLKIRNPNDSDLNWIYEYSPTHSWKREVGLISRCIHSINGRVLKGDDGLYWLSDFMSSQCSRHLVRNLAIATVSLLEEVKKAQDYLEPFSYELESRNIWRNWRAMSSVGEPLPMRLNDFQIYWASWNQLEDEKIATKTEWEQALLITSAFNSKGAKEIRSGWESNDAEEKQYREALMKDAHRGIVGTVEQRRSQARRNNFDDLREQMRKWVAGEEDEHDRIVREYKQSMYRKIELEKERAEQARERNRRMVEDLNSLKNISSINAPVTAISDEEVRRMTSVKKYKQSNEHQEKFEHVKERYIMAKETSGNLQIGEDGKLISNTPNKPSLMSEIANRVPTLEEK